MLIGKNSRCPDKMGDEKYVKSTSHTLFPPSIKGEIDLFLANQEEISVPLLISGVGIAFVAITLAAVVFTWRRKPNTTAR